MYGLSIIIRNEAEFNRVKEFLGKEILYLDFVPQMEIQKHFHVIHFRKQSLKEWLMPIVRLGILE